MPSTVVKQTMNNLEKKYSTDGPHKLNPQQIEEMTEMHSKERFKAMKELDRQNERASPKQIAKR